MSNNTILPADTFIVVNRTFISDKDRRIISMLYQPIIGSLATALYYTLWTDLDKSEIMSIEYTHHHLMTSLRIRLDNIIEARNKLEAVGLIRVYIKQGDVNSYVYELYSPLEANDFLTHPILNIVLYNNIGKIEYQKILEYFKCPKVNLSNYKEITSSFSDIFESVKGNTFDNLNHDIKRVQINNICIESEFDFDLLISSVPKGVLNTRTFSKDIKDLILKLAFVYNMDASTMSNIVITSIKTNGIIDKELLRKTVRNFYKYQNNDKLPSLMYKKQPEYLRVPEGDISKRAKMIYTFESTTPYNFFKSKSNGAVPSSRDLKLIEDLLTDFMLNPGVVNVLVDYVLKINNKKLTKNFIDTIAAQWKRLNIETVEEAMTLAEKEHKRYNKRRTVVKKDSKALPEWFNQDIEKKEVSKEEEERLKNLLKEFGGNNE